MLICTECGKDLPRSRFAKNKNRKGACKNCNRGKCKRTCSNCKMRFTSAKYTLTTRTALMEYKTVRCDDCTHKFIREEEHKQEVLLCEKMQSNVCKVMPDGAHQVDVEKLKNLCTRSYGMPLSFDKRKALWIVMQNAAIAPKDKEHVEAICNFLRQIPIMHSELQSFGLDDIITYEYETVTTFIKEMEEPFEASIAKVFEYVLRCPYWKPNRTQCKRWLSQFSLNHYRVCTLLCLQSMCSKFPNGRAIQNLHVDIMEYIGIEKYASAVLTRLQELNKKQYNF